jgi:site-specific DNA-methyltransferase (adenine-specific)
LKPWFGRVFMNPPYGKTIGRWMRKAWEEAHRGALVVCLVPARVDTAWWHDYAARGEVRFPRGRVTFANAPNPAPFPVAIVVFRPPDATSTPGYGR